MRTGLKPLKFRTEMCTTKSCCNNFLLFLDHVLFFGYSKLGLAGGFPREAWPATARPIPLKDGQQVANDQKKITTRL